MTDKLLRLRNAAVQRLGRLSSVAPLLSRIVVGWVFVQSGWGKLNHLANVVEFFTSLGIPAPQIQAPIVAGLEFLCGLLLLGGLFTRLAAVPMCATMVVALLTAQKDQLHTLSALFGLSEFLYIVLLLWLIFDGAGRLSLDAWLERRLVGRSSHS